MNSDLLLPVKRKHFSTISRLSVMSSAASFLIILPLKSFPDVAASFAAELRLGLCRSSAVLGCFIYFF